MKKALKWLDENFELFILSILMILMSAVMFLQCFMRYVMNASLSWPEELSRYLFVYFVYFGMSYCVRADTHLSVDVIPSFFPKLRPLYSAIADVSMFVFSLVMAVGGIGKLSQLINRPQYSPAMRFPMQYVYIALEIGFILPILRLIQKYVVRMLGCGKKQKSIDEGSPI